MNEERKGFAPSGEEPQKTQQILPAAPVSQYEQGLNEIPHAALVERIRQTVEQAKRRWEAQGKKGAFDPVEHIGFLLTPTFQENPLPAEKDLAAAWDAIS